MPSEIYTLLAILFFAMAALALVLFDTMQRLSKLQAQIADLRVEKAKRDTREHMEKHRPTPSNVHKLEERRRPWRQSNPNDQKPSSQG